MLLYFKKTLMFEKKNLPYSIFLCPLSNCVPPSKKFLDLKKKHLIVPPKKIWDFLQKVTKNLKKNFLN